MKTEWKRDFRMWALTFLNWAKMKIKEKKPYSAGWPEYAGLCFLWGSIFTKAEFSTSTKWRLTVRRMCWEIYSIFLKRMSSLLRRFPPSTNSLRRTCCPTSVKNTQSPSKLKLVPSSLLIWSKGTLSKAMITTSFTKAKSTSATKKVETTTHKLWDFLISSYNCPTKWWTIQSFKKKIKERNH